MGRWAWMHPKECLVERVGFALRVQWQLWTVHFMFAMAGHQRLQQGRRLCVALTAAAMSITMSAHTMQTLTLYGI